MTQRESVLKGPIEEIVGGCEQGYLTSTIRGDFGVLINELVPHVANVEHRGSDLFVTLDSKVDWEPPYRTADDGYKKEMQWRLFGELSRAAVNAAARLKLEGSNVRAETTALINDLIAEASWLLDRNPFWSKEEAYSVYDRVEKIPVHEAIERGFDWKFKMPERPPRDWGELWATIRRTGASASVLTLFVAQCTFENPTLDASEVPGLTQTVEPYVTEVFATATELPPTPEDPIRPYPKNSGDFLLGFGGEDTDRQQVLDNASDSVAWLDAYYEAEMNRSGIIKSNMVQVFVLNRAAETWAMVYKDPASGLFMIPQITSGAESGQLVRSLILGGNYFERDFGDDFFDFVQLANPAGIVEQKLVGDQSGWNVVVGYDKDGRPVAWVDMDKEGKWEFLDGFLPSGAATAEYDISLGTWVALDSNGNQIMKLEGGEWIMELPAGVVMTETYKGDLYGINEAGRAVVVQNSRGEWEEFIGKVGKSCQIIEGFNDCNLIPGYMLEPMEEKDIKPLYIHNQAGQRVAVTEVRLPQFDKGPDVWSDGVSEWRTITGIIKGAVPWEYSGNPGTVKVILEVRLKWGTQILPIVISGQSGAAKNIVAFRDGDIDGSLYYPSLSYKELINIVSNPNMIGQMIAVDLMANKSNYPESMRQAHARLYQAILSGEPVDLEGRYEGVVRKGRFFLPDWALNYR